MGELRISLPDDLHKKLKRKALDEDTSLKDLVIQVLKACAEHGIGTGKAPEQAQAESE